METRKISAEDMTLINGFAKRELRPEDVYTFTLVAADTKIDRDYECFTPKTLKDLAKLFVGTAIIMDHCPSARNQSARVFRSYTRAAPGDENVTQLMVDAYTIREGNEELIGKIDGGILKEVSVGCAIRQKRCTVCGKNFDRCRHEKGKSYNGVVCAVSLDGAADAYEISFVAVPAQREAGVIKCQKSFSAGGAVVTTGEEVIPYVACAHSEELSNGHLNLYKYFKVKFAPNEMTAQQVSDGSVTFSTTQVQGAYFRNETIDMMRAIYYDVDPTTETGAAIIENWFSAATYIGSNGLANTSTMKKGTTVINNGDSVAEGELSFNGSATGGTTPYKYSFYYRAAGSDTWTAKQEDSTTATATQTVDVSTDTDYEFKLVVKDANGVTLTRLVTATITAST